MIIKGRYNEAVIFTDQLDASSRMQIEKLLNHPTFAGHKIRIMPDVHAGAGCVIGLSMNFSDKVVPNLVGVDIGCGVLTTELNTKALDLVTLDETIRTLVPSGFNIHKHITDKHRTLANDLRLSTVKAPVDMDRALKSIGTLGGGNHFIEVGQAKDGRLYLFVHSGSRHFGYQIAQYYQKRAINNNPDMAKGSKDLAHLEGTDLKDYLHDMACAAAYAKTNRAVITHTLIEAMHLDVESMFDTVHNTIDLNDRMIRKGAVSARKNQKLVIPLTMKDGVILAVGKGNTEWNQTAPHGAGRRYSRKVAKRVLSMDAFKQAMDKVYTTSVNRNTLDEAPMAYKSVDALYPWLHETVDIIDTIRPIYNFKAT